MKKRIKKLLGWMGILHPSLGIKISQEAKAAIILEHKTPELRIFVETGTHEGWMVDKIGHLFQKVYSVELDESLYRKDVERFRSKEYVKLLKGDSAVEINKILVEINEPALFWLDAHASGGITAENSPIMDELMAIFAHRVNKHIILIDDARHFDRETIRRMKKIAKNKNYAFNIENGIFRLYGR